MTPELLEKILCIFGALLFVYVLVMALRGVIYDVRKVREVRRRPK